jgi:hypothetical protein
MTQNYGAGQSPKRASPSTREDSFDDDHQIGQLESKVLKSAAAIRSLSGQARESSLKKLRTDFEKYMRLAQLYGRTPQDIYTVEQAVQPLLEQQKPQESHTGAHFQEAKGVPNSLFLDDLG